MKYLGAISDDLDLVNKKYVDDSIPSLSLNGTSTTSASFYAPTTAGTNGNYLKSNGSGAPTWASFPSIPSAGTTATAVGTSTSGGSATTWSKSDHVHSISSSTITSALGFTPSSTDNQVAQNNNTDDSVYRVLLSSSANDNNETAGSKKSAYLKFNPATPRFYVGSHVETGAIEYYSQAGVGNEANGITLDSHSATSYSSAWTPGTFRLQHWNESKGSGGSITPANFVNEMVNIGTDSIYLRTYNDLNNTTNMTSLNSSSMLLVPGDSWSNATQGIQLSNNGTIYLKSGSTTASTITPSKITSWDGKISGITQTNGNTLNGAYRFLLSNSNDNNTETSANTYKSYGFYYNPNTFRLQIGSSTSNDAIYIQGNTAGYNAIKIQSVTSRY